MENLVNIAKAMNLDKIDLTTIFLVIIPIVFVMYVSYKGTMMQLAVRIVTKERLKFGKVLLPTVFSILSGVLLIFLSYILLKALGINVKELGINIAFKYEYDASKLVYVILAVFLSQVINMLCTGYIMQMKNFDVYVWIGTSIRKLFNKTTKNEVKDISSEVLTKKDIEMTKNGETQRIDLSELNPYENTKLGYVNGILCSLLMLAVTFFICVVLVLLGVFCGELFMKMLG